MSNLVGLAMILIESVLQQGVDQDFEIEFLFTLFYSLDGYIELPPSAIDTCGSTLARRTVGNSIELRTMNATKAAKIIVEAQLTKILHRVSTDTNTMR
jgi:hypothetical protein